MLATFCELPCFTSHSALSSIFAKQILEINVQLLASSNSILGDILRISFFDKAFCIPVNLSRKCVSSNTRSKYWRFRARYLLLTNRLACTLISSKKSGTSYLNFSHAPCRVRDILRIPDGPFLLEHAVQLKPTTTRTLHNNDESNNDNNSITWRIEGTSMGQRATCRV